VLFYTTVKPRTLELLKALMEVPEHRAFNLAGGTSLSLQIGHRISVDLDLFGNHPFQADEMLQSVKNCGNVKILHKTKNILMLDIEGIKVEIVNYSYSLVKDFSVEDGIRLLSLEDIGAMKLAAITGRGRKRDLYDLFFLLKKFSLDQILGFYRQKYPDGNEWLVARSIIYFEDANNDLEMRPFQKILWTSVKKQIEKEAAKLFS